MSDEDDFLSRWSRRKRLVKTEDQTPTAEPLPPLDPEAEGDEDEAALLEKLGLPSPESLGPGDDFRAFMADGVPAFLRRRALRVLWRSNPVLANLDGLNDYDDDFTSPELTKKVLATAYQVGRGIISHKIEPEASVDTPVPAPDDEPIALVPDDVVEDLGPKDETQPATLADDPEPSPRPRRMRFET